jgi:hypothetical protein
MKNESLLMKTRLLRLSPTALVRRSSSLVAVAAFFTVACCGASAGVRADSRGSHRHELDWNHRQVIQVEREHAGYWSAMAPGMVLAALPAGYVQVSVGDTGYYYYDGVFFRPLASLSAGYVVVVPPVGVIVPQLPAGAELVTIGGAPYYYAGGAFYVEQPTGFGVAPAPTGAVIKAPRC